MSKAQRESIHSYDEHLGRRRVPRRDPLVPPTDREAALRRLPSTAHAARSLAAVVGFLVCVELASGVLQGYYTPIYPRHRRPPRHPRGRRQLVRGGPADRLRARRPARSPGSATWSGTRRCCCCRRRSPRSARGSLAIAPNFTTFLIGWAVQGAYVVWLPLEIAIIHRRTARLRAPGAAHPAGAAVLVGALELAVIIGALTSGALVDGIVDERPAGAARRSRHPRAWSRSGRHRGRAGRVDRWHRLARAGLVTLALGLVMAGLVVIRLDGAGSIARPGC